MRNFIFTFLGLLGIILFTGCQQQTDHHSGNDDKYRQQIDSLEKKLIDFQNEVKSTYVKPGYASTMGEIERFYIKLWFAGQEENWDLADFYHHELEGNFELLEEYRSDNSATANMHMIKPSLDSIHQSIANQNRSDFKTGYKNMTQSCTACHIASDHPEIIIRVPSKNPYDSQEFKSDK